MEDLLVSLSVICSSLLFLSVPIAFITFMRRIRRKELAALAKHGYT